MVKRWTMVVMGKLMLASLCLPDTWKGAGVQGPCGELREVNKDINY